MCVQTIRSEDNRVTGETWHDIKTKRTWDHCLNEMFSTQQMFVMLHTHTSRHNSIAYYNTILKVITHYMLYYIYIFNLNIKL